MLISPSIKNANFSQNLRCEVNLVPRDQSGNQPPLFYKEILEIGEVTEMTKKPCAIVHGCLKTSTHGFPNKRARSTLL